MTLPFFYTPVIEDDVITLDEETSRHIVQVLRMESDQRIRLTDGKGNAAEATISDPHKKHCKVSIETRISVPANSKQVTIAISLVKNASRFEWFLEKATEMGVSEIIPLVCIRTVSQKFKADRYDGILKSAMLQSQQTYLPRLTEPVQFSKLIGEAQHHQRFIAHCVEEEKISLHSAIDPLLDSHIILIGPEGDFTADEITHAKNSGFVPVTLGNTRLRTETAGLYAAAICSTFL